MRSKLMWQRCLSVLLALCMVAAYLLPGNIVRAEDAGAVLWVDPVNGSDTNDGTTETNALKTISAAKTKAAQLSESSNVVVYLKGGTYTEGTITFGEAESGKNGNTITYSSAAGETAIISGGTRLEGWTLHDESKNIYVTDIPAGAELTRQFYVNGQPMPNAYTETSPTDWLLLSSGGYMSPNVDSADNNEYLILDLGEEKPVSKVTLYSGTKANENGTAAGFPKDFTISTSVNGDDWAVQVTETDYAAPAINVGVAFEFNAVQARYVKIDVTELGAPDRLNRAKYNLTLAEVVVGLAAQVGNVDLSGVEHLDLTTNLLSTDNLASFKVGYYSDRATMKTFVEYIPGWVSDPVKNLTDGKEGTYASTKGFKENWFLANGGQYTFVYVTELKEAVSIGAIKLTTGNTQGSLPTDFEVQISTNNSSWTTVVKEENFDWTAVGHQKIFAFNPDAVKYIRILGHKTTAFTDGDYYLRFTEMALYKPSNVALGAEVEVSTEQKPDATWDKAYLVDGKFGGQYTSRATGSATTVDATITLGFSEAKEIAGIRLYPRYTSKGLVHYITSARFSVSTDGNTFETVFELSNIEPPASGAQLFVFPEAKEAKYIRIEPLCIEHGAETDYRFQLKEIEVAPATETSSEVNFDAVITQGNATSNNGVSYNAKSITAKNDNAEIEFNALKAIDGIIIPVDDCGWYVPESYNFKEIGNLTDIEVHVLNNWYHNILRIDGVSNNGTEVSAETMGLRPTWLANAYEFIDRVGEWYIDRTVGKIYYKAADTMEGVEAVLPAVEQVIDMKDASNIVFDGITFEHTSYTLPSEIGYEDAQANTQVHNGWTQVNGGIMLDSCQNITITNSVIRNMGTVGIKVRSNASVSDNVQITNNRIYDISYSGIIVGEVYGHHGYKSSQLVTNTVIRNNYITRVGIDMFDSPAITATYTNGTIIDHNEVSYCPYTGISTGWGWDDEVEKDTGNALEEVGNLQITNNFVHDVMKTNRDGGAIYNLGTSKDSVISGNYLYNSWDGDDNLERMIYLDEGSSWIEVYDNVIGAEGGDWMNMWISSIKENHWHDNYYDASLSQRNDGTDNIIENNTAVENGNFEAYPEAMEIINNAGLLTPELKEGVDKGFAPEHDIVQEKYSGITSRYIETAYGWRNISIEGQSSNTMSDSVTKQVTIYMPAGTDLTALALLFDLEDGFTSNKASGSVQDFSAPVTYTLTNGETTVSWTVTVKTESVAGGDIVGTDVTLDDAIENYDSANWTKAPSASTEDSLTFNTYSGYIGERFGTDAILHFDMTSSLNDGSKDWLQISLRNQDPYTMCINGNTEYNIGFNYDNIEVQKFVNGERTVLYGIIEGYEAIFGDIPNDYYTPDERHSITVGAINVDSGVRLFLYVDGNLVFDIIDADDPITDDGYFAVYGMTHPITLSKFTDIQKLGTDVSLDDAIENYDSAEWTKSASASTEDSLTFNTYSGYIGERFGTDTVLNFDMTSNLTVGGKDWLQISLRNQDPYTMCIKGNTEYNIGFNYDNIEVQKFVNGERTVLYGIIEGYQAIFGSIPNDYYTPNERHSITVGAINVTEGVRLFLYVDGNLVFDIIDADDPITDDGFFAVYGMTHPITLSTFTDNQKAPVTVDTTALEEAIANAEAVDAEEYTEESVAALTVALEAAKAVLENADATQEEVDAAVEALNAALEALDELCNHNYVDGICSVCGAREPFDIDGANMTLGNSLAMNFYILPSDLVEGETYYAVITKEYADGRDAVTVTVEQADWTWHTGYGEWYVSFNGVAAKEMTDTITVVVYNSNDEAVSNVWVDSVQAYTMRVLLKEEAKASPSAEKLTLYVDMLNYGAAAQVEFEYNTENLANNQLTEAQAAYATDDDIALSDKRVKGEGYSATNLTLESDITMNFFFLASAIPTEHDDYYAIATWTDHYGKAKEVRVEGEDFGQLTNDTDWYVPVKGAVVADGRQLVTVTVYNGEGDAVATGTDSIESYVARNVEKKAIYLAIMKFCVSAYELFH